MKSYQKGFTVVEGVIILAIVVLVGGITWFFIEHNAKPNSPDETLSAITKDMNNTFSDVEFKNHNTWNAEMEATSYDKVAGYDFSVSDVGKNVWFIFEGEGKPRTITQYKFIHKTLQPAANMSLVVGRTKDVLVKYGYTSSDNKIYKKGDEYCTVAIDSESLFPNITNYNSDVQGDSNLLQVNCFTDAELQAAAGQLKPFVDAYVAANQTTKASDITAGPVTIKSSNDAGVIGSSHQAGDDIAEMVVTINGKKQVALFYAKNADIVTHKNSGWIFVTQANDEYGFKCGDMAANPDSRKAFYDQVCLSANGQVRLDTNNRALQ